MSSVHTPLPDHPSVQTLRQGDLAGGSTTLAKPSSVRHGDGYTSCSHLATCDHHLGNFFQMPIPGALEILIQLVWAGVFFKLPNKANMWRPEFTATGEDDRIVGGGLLHPPVLH